MKMTKLDFLSLVKGQKVITNNLKNNKTMIFREVSSLMEHMALCSDDDGQTEDILYVFIDIIEKKSSSCEEKLLLDEDDKIEEIPVKFDKDIVDNDIVANNPVKRGRGRPKKSA